MQTLISFEMVAEGRYITLFRFEVIPQNSHFAIICQYSVVTYDKNKNIFF